MLACRKIKEANFCHRFCGGLERVSWGGDKGEQGGFGLSICRGFMFGKKANRANKVSFLNHKMKKLQFVNLQYKRVWLEVGKCYLKLRLSTKALDHREECIGCCYG